LLYFYID